MHVADDNVEFKKNNNRLWIVTIVLIILAFVIGIVIGHFAITKTDSTASEDDTLTPLTPDVDTKADFKRRSEEIAKHHNNFQAAIKEKNLNNSLKYFSERPHIAGSDRQKELANELEKRWKEYGFDHVEKPEYKALLSFPDRNNPTRITIKYKNQTIIHQVKAEEQEGGSSKDVVPPFNGYSPSGTVEGDLVYVNYGRVEDFEKLKNLSVNVTGKITIMRYGKIFRGNKVENAANYGAKAALLYSDPADYAKAGTDPKDTYPNTAWLPSSGVQRGSLYTFPGAGDPQTPGIGAIPGMWRRSQNDSKLPTIPTHPMGYADAIHFLSKIGGPEAPKEWRGTLDITYHLGPGFTDSEITVSVDVRNYYQVKSIYNVIGTIYGSVEPDRFVLIGNHRDSWVYGAVDASTGTAVTTEIARGLGELKKAGWRPRRTIKICSWGGEEYSIIGSVEWVEQHEKILTERAVIYLNADTAVGGNYVLSMSSTPSVKDIIREFSKTIKSPSAYDDKQTIFDVTAERNPVRPKTDPAKPAVGDLGSGSDFASFVQYAGVSAIDFHYVGYNNTAIFYPVYHSQHDTFAYVKKFVDPEFKYHKASAQLCGGLLLLFADAPLLNMSVMLYADALNGSLNALKSQYGEQLKDHSVTLGLLEKAVTEFQGTAKNFTKAKDEVEKKLNDFDEPSFAELSRLNDRMIKLERAFIYSYGLPGRRLVRHVIFAPSKYNLYGSSSFPGVSDILFKLKETGDNDEVDKQLSIAVQGINAAVDIISGPY